MAEICCGVVSDQENSVGCETSSQAAARKRMEIRRVNELKRPRLGLCSASFSRDCNDAIENCSSDSERNDGETKQILPSNQSILSPLTSAILNYVTVLPKFGVASVCGRRRDMEDAVTVHPSLCAKADNFTSELHYFGVYDGHGCSHVATRCKDRLHELVKDELMEKVEDVEWSKAMEQSFNRMDKEVIAWNQAALGTDCRCELQAPESDAVGSTAVVAIVTPDKIIVANCGDSRAVLCRSGKAVPLSTDHKPDRPDELNRIQAAGGRVIYWDGPRVLGVLAMSRAIGDNYLKPYVSCEPEVTITERTAEDDCLIMASDGLWDVVSNDTACGVARMCLKGKGPSAAVCGSGETSLEDDAGFENSDKACSDASLLLTKLALARRSTDNVSVVVIDLRKGS